MADSSIWSTKNGEIELGEENLRSPRPEAVAGILKIAKNTRNIKYNSCEPGGGGGSGIIQNTSDSTNVRKNTEEKENFRNTFMLNQESVQQLQTMVSGIISSPRRKISI